MQRRRILCLWFPRLAQDLAAVAGESVPLAPAVFVAGEASGLEVHFANRAARQAGVLAGMALHDVSSMVPDLTVMSADIAGEKRQLAELVQWAGSYSPTVGLGGEDTLLVDISGTEALFGTEQQLAQTMVREAYAMGFLSHAAVVSSAQAASAVARHVGVVASSLRRQGSAARARLQVINHSHQVDLASVSAAEQVAEQAAVCASWLVIVPSTGTAQAARVLPVECVCFAPRHLELCHDLGLKSVGDLLDLPRAGFLRRFGAPALEQLDKLAARRGSAITPSQPRQPIAVSEQFAEVIATLEGLIAVISRLVDSLCTELERASLAAEQVAVRMQRQEQEPLEFTVGMYRATQDSDTIKRIIGVRLETVDCQYGFEGVCLEAVRSRSWAARHGELDEMAPLPSAGDTDSAFTAREREAEDALVAMLVARLGTGAVFSVQRAAGHLPEDRSCLLDMAGAGLETAASRAAEAAPIAADAHSAPVALLFPPLPLAATPRLGRRVLLAGQAVYLPPGLRLVSWEVLRVAAPWWQALQYQPPDNASASARAGGGAPSESAAAALSLSVARSRSYVWVADEHGGLYWIYWLEESTVAEALTGDTDGVCEHGESGQSVAEAREARAAANRRWFWAGIG